MRETNDRDRVQIIMYQINGIVDARLRQKKLKWEAVRVTLNNI